MPGILSQCRGWKSGPFASVASTLPMEWFPYPASVNLYTYIPDVMFPGLKKKKKTLSGKSLRSPGLRPTNHAADTASLALQMFPSVFISITSPRALSSFVMAFKVMWKINIVFRH